jgi:hypothetical protein
MADAATKESLSWWNGDEADMLLQNAGYGSSAIKPIEAGRSPQVAEEQKSREVLRGAIPVS